MRNQLLQNKVRMERMGRALETLSPLAILERGYALVFDGAGAIGEGCGAGEGGGGDYGAGGAGGDSGGGEESECGATLSEQKSSTSTESRGEATHRTAAVMESSNKHVRNDRRHFDFAQDDRALTIWSRH